MGYGTSFFNKTVYKSALRRFWPLALAFAVIEIFQLQGVIGSYYQSEEAFLNLCMEGMRSYLPAAASGIMALAVYGWLYQLRPAAFVSALPVRREALFLSHGAAGLTLLLAGLAAAGLITPFLSTGHAFAFPTLGQWALISALLCTAYFGLASFCAVLTGQFLAMPALYLVFLYAAVALEASLRRIAQFLIFGLTGQRWALTILSPVYYLRNSAYNLVETVYEYEETLGRVMLRESRFLAWPLLIFYAAAGIAFTVLAVVLLRRRRMESAGEVVAAPALRPVFRWCMAAAMALSAGLLTLDSVFGFTGYYSANSSFHRTVILLLVMLLGSFLGWFGAEMLLRKTLRVFDRRWGGWATLGLVITALVLGCRLDVLGVTRRMPDADKVGHAVIRCYYSNVMDTEYWERENIEEVLALHRKVVEEREAFTYDGASDGAGGSLGIDYYDTEGKLILRREYAAPAGELAWTSSGNAYYWTTYGNALQATLWGSANPCLADLERLVNVPEAVEQRLTSNDLDISRETAQNSTVFVTAPNGGLMNVLEVGSAETWDLYRNAVLPDSRESSLGNKRLLPDPNAEDPTGQILIYLNFSDQSNSWDSFWWFLSVNNTGDARRLNAWLEAHGIRVDEQGRAVFWETGNGEIKTPATMLD